MYEVRFDHQVRYVQDELELLELILRLLQRNPSLEMRIRRVTRP